MKKLFLALAILATAAVPAAAQEWRQTNQLTFSWNVVDKIAPSDTIKYQVFTKEKSGALAPSGGEILQTQATVTFTVEGRYRLCAQAVRYAEGEIEPITSEVSCSDVAEVCLNGQTFVVRYFVKPNPPRDLR